jgi:glycosyltransferase involved in cell wall biosynthesis
MNKYGERAALIIPALDEEDAIGGVIAAVDRDWVEKVIVVDNGSRDQTGTRAVAAGAEVVVESRRGYGIACQTGIRAAGDADVIVIMDGDGSDDPAEIGEMLTFMHQTGADMVIGSRVLGQTEPGALTPVQAFGNTLTCTLVRWLWGVRYTDLGPFRAMRKKALDSLDMNDPDFGWNIEMQVKAAQKGLRVEEMPVTRRLRQAGKSKISGTVLGSYRAGKTILGYVFSAKLRELLPR